MADSLSCTAGLQNLRLVADRPKEAGAHFPHDAVCAALLALMLPRTQVDACTADKPIGVSRDVGVKPLELIGQEGDPSQSMVIRLRHCVRQQFINLIANGKGLFQ